MPPKCILFYKTAAADERLEAVLDRESTAGRLELLGVSAEEQSMVPPARRALPFFSPAAISGMAFDYAVVIEASAGEKRDRARSRVKRLLPPFLLRLHSKIAAWRFTRKKRRLWQSFDGWGKPIERQPDMVLPERSPLGAWSIPVTKTIPARTFLLPGFRMDEYAALRTRGITFLSDNCWGGLMYHTLGMEMTSPFINMFVWTDDFIRLINDLPYYLSQPLVPEKLRERRGAACPVVLLGGIEWIWILSLSRAASTRRKIRRSTKAALPPARTQSSFLRRIHRKSMCTFLRSTKTPRATRATFPIAPATAPKTTTPARYRLTFFGRFSRGQRSRPKKRNKARRATFC